MKNIFDIFKTKLVFILLFLFLVIAFYFNSTTDSAQHFTYLARSFLQGKTYFTQSPGGWMDTVYHNEQYYWPLGFLPAVILMPFVFLADKFGLFFYQGFVSFFLGLLIIYFIIKIGKKLLYSTDDSVYWALAFCFSSAFIALYLAPSSWYFGQVVTVALTFWLLYEYLHQKRYWLIFLIAILVLLTRMTAGLAVFLFILFDTLFLQSNKTYIIKNLGLFFLSGAIGVAILFIYNYLRFQNIFDYGYNKQILDVTPAIVKAKEYGIFSWFHLPGNLYYSLIAAPLPLLKDGVSMVLKFPYLKPNPWGMGLFITSPYLVYMFFLKYRDKFSKITLIVVFLSLIPILTYYGNGYVQYGSRYLFDMMPFLFLLFIKNYQQQNPKISLGLKVIIIFSAFFNLYLFLAFRSII